MKAHWRPLPPGQPPSAPPLLQAQRDYCGGLPAYHHHYYHQAASAATVAVVVV